MKMGLTRSGPPGRETGRRSPDGIKIKVHIVSRIILSFLAIKGKIKKDKNQDGWGFLNEQNIGNGSKEFLNFSMKMDARGNLRQKFE